MFRSLFPRAAAARAVTPSKDRALRGRFEQCEDRRLMAADVLLGSVYFEEATGDDSRPDVIQVSFVGGAAGTTLDRLVIDTDKLGDGLTTGDVFFDVSSGDPGSFGSVPLSIVSNQGFTVNSVEVVDGGSKVIFTFSGFDAGEKLVFSVDVDEVSFVGGGAIDTNPLAEGAEFQRSKMTGEFSAPGFVDLTLGGTYWDAFDDDFDAAEAAAGLTLANLPPDRYDEATNRPDRTAGAAANAKQLELARLSGFVYHDRDDDGVFDSGEAPIAGVTLELLNGAGQGTGVTTVTGAQGFYEFTNLEAGVWGVRETQPSGWFDGKDTAGSKGGVAANDVITGATLAYGDRGENYNFGELLGASIAGRVGASRGADCKFDAPDVLLEGVLIELLSPGGAVLASTRTNAQGEYKFTGLRPGEYQVRETQPTGYYDGGERAGSVGGTVSNDLLSAIVLGSGVDAVRYDFCEKIGANLAGYVYHDRDNDGVYDRAASPESPIAAVTLKLLRADGTDTGARAVTDSRGFYEFLNLAAGTYRVMEVHPTDWLDGKDTPGSKGGTAENPGDMISEITLAYGDDAVEYNFGELLPASISGRVGASRGADCKFDDPDLLLSGVTIELLDPQGNVLRTTLTNALGEYRFDDLAPAVYQVRERQPAGYYDGGERVGSAGGVATNDLISQVRLDSDVDAVHYDFCEKIGADLSGYVYHDRDDDGVRDPGEEPIPGAMLKLMRPDGTDTGARAITDANGFYKFSNLSAGTYCVMEVQPTGWIDGKDTAGSLGGEAMNPGDMICEITIGYGDNATEYNFGELLPGAISGLVRATPDGQCPCECGDIDPETGLPTHDGNDQSTPLAGVTIELLDAQGRVLRGTTTDAQGRYSFVDLAPGNYTVRQVQPTNYFDGSTTLGSGGGDFLDNNTMTNIVVGSGSLLDKYDFCEALPAELSGYVFIDGAPIVTNGALPEDLATIRDGKRTADDTPLAGVRMILVDGVTGAPIDPSVALPGYYGVGPIETRTDARGYYQFLGLPAGTYGVVQISPAGLIDGIDTAGSTGGIAVNPVIRPVLGPGDELEPHELQQFRNGYGNDVIYRIALGWGQSSIENNFSEVRIAGFFLPPDDPNPDPPQPLLPGPSALPPRAPRPLNAVAPTPESGFGGSSQVIGYTWHLSVVNAGQPRATAEGAEVEPLLASTGQGDPPWRNADRDAQELRRAKWRLLEGEEGARDLSELLFGDEDAVPVSGDWNGDGSADVGVFVAGDWYLDLNGDGRWGAGDLWAHLGSDDDQPVTGDWDGDGKTDIGIFGPAWPLDPHAIPLDPGQPDLANFPGPIAEDPAKEKNLPPTEDEATSGARLLRRAKELARRMDRIDHVYLFGDAGDAAVAGDWNGDGIRAIGVFRDGAWTLDTNGDGRFGEDDRQVTLGGKGDLPVVGDWNGDGIDDLGVFRPGVDGGQWLIDGDGDGLLTAADSEFVRDEAFATVGDAARAAGASGTLPISGDWDGDGRDEPGLFTPGEADETVREASLPRKAG
ncbi:MAG: SdrD B-like domain-containing protein [Lacipirellulaceae bacterium]